MSTWQIEHIPASGGTSTLATLGAWGFASLQMQFTNWGVDQAAATVRGGSIAFAAAQFGYLDKLVVWRDGARHSHWWIVGPALNAEVQESRTYTLAGPAWWLEQTPFAHPQHVVDVTTDPGTGAATGCTWEMLHGTEVIWTSWPEQSSGTINGQINRALWCAKDNDAPIGIGAVDMPGLAAPISGSGTCMSVIQQAARLLPRSACWWDSSGATPLFHASSRAGLSTQTLTIGTHDIEAFGLQPRADQRMDVVRVVYTYPNGDSTAAWFDTAGDTTLKDGPNTLRAVVECSTGDIASNAASHFGIAAQLYNALSETPWEGAVNIHDTGVGLPDVPLGTKLCLSGGRSEWQAMAASIKQISISISPRVNDVMTVAFGPPPALGAQDIFEALAILTRAANGAVSTGGGTTEPSDPADDSPVPGTIDDLNGGTGAAPAGALLTQAQGGTCRISGCPPLDGIETYRRWRTQTASGTLHKYGWVGNYVCAYDPSGHTSYALSGTCQWTASDDVTVTNSMQYVDESSVVHAMNYGVIPLPGSPFQSDAGTESTTPTVHQYVANGECISENGTPASSHRSTGSDALTLRNEDTEDSAWTRMLALTSPAWATSETGTYSARAELTFLRQLYRYGLGALDGDSIGATSGWTPWGVYEVVIQLQIHPVTAAGALTADGTWSDLAQRQHLIQSDIDGKARIDWKEEEPPRGYALRAVLVSVYPVTS